MITLISIIDSNLIDFLLKIDNNHIKINKKNDIKGNYTL